MEKIHSAVRGGYLLLAALVFAPVIALGAWMVQVWGSISLLPCAGATACTGAPAVRSWPVVLWGILGLVLLRKGVYDDPRSPEPRGGTTPSGSGP